MTLLLTRSSNSWPWAWGLPLNSFSGSWITRWSLIFWKVASGWILTVLCVNCLTESHVGCCWNLQLSWCVLKYCIAEEPEWKKPCEEPEAPAGAGISQEGNFSSSLTQLVSLLIKASKRVPASVHDRSLFGSMARNSYVNLKWRKSVIFLESA